MAEVKYDRFNNEECEEAKIIGGIGDEVKDEREEVEEERE